MDRGCNIFRLIVTHIYHIHAYVIQLKMLIYFNMNKGRPWTKTCIQNTQRRLLLLLSLPGYQQLLDGGLKRKVCHRICFAETDCIQYGNGSNYIQHDSKIAFYFVSIDVPLIF